MVMTEWHVKVRRYSARPSLLCYTRDLHLAPGIQRGVPVTTMEIPGSMQKPGLATTTSPARTPYPASDR